MRYLFILLASAIIFTACSSSQELQVASMNQQECRNETELQNPNEFIGETAENFMVTQQGKHVFASMDLRTYCNARIAFDVERNEDQIMLRLKNNNTITDDCVCIMNVSTSLSGVDDGTYTIMVTNATGQNLLAKQTITVID